MVLDVKAAMEIEEIRYRTDTIMNILMRDPEFKSLLIKKIKELNLLGEGSEYVRHTH